MNSARTARLIIDGYSLLHRDPELAPLLNRNLALARQLLIRKVDRVIDQLAMETTIVFDGKGPRGQADDAGGRIEIVFAPPHLTADTVIERLVCRDSKPERILVVSSDRMERQAVEAAGAESLSCGDFLERCRTVSAAYARRRPSPADRPGTLGDYFPL